MGTNFKYTQMKRELEILVSLYEELIEEYKDDKIFAINSGEIATINAKIAVLSKVILDLKEIL